jgi:hypothetical protein
VRGGWGVLDVWVFVGAGRAAHTGGGSQQQGEGGQDSTRSHTVISVFTAQVYSTCIYSTSQEEAASSKVRQGWGVLDVCVFVGAGRAAHTGGGS